MGKTVQNTGAWAAFLRGDNPDCDILPENVPAFEAFCKIAEFGLWRFYPMGGVAGIDWVQVQAHPGLRGVEIPDGVAAIERAAVLELNDKRNG